MKNFFIFIASISIYCTWAQSPKEQLALVNAVILEETNFFTKINYQDTFGLIVIPATIGNETYHYIFDTGGYNTLTSEIFELNNLESIMEVEVGSANKIKSKVRITKIPSMIIGGLHFNNVGALNLDFQNSPQISCYTNGGLIGRSLIKEAVWQINSLENTLIVTHDLNKLDHLDNAVKMKVKFDKTYNPFIKAKINGTTYTFLLDLGFDGLVSLTEKDGTKVKSEGVIEIIGEGSVSANGILKESTFLKNINTFSLGERNFSKQVISYSKSKNYNIIGADITKYFIVTLNFPKKELYLSPIPSKTEAPKKSFGFTLNQKDTTVYVNKIFKGQSAEKAGLQVNDSIVSINGVDLSNSKYCEFYAYIESLLDEHEPILLQVKRADKIFNITINKANMF